MHSELLAALGEDRHPTILVVGDLMYDRYVWGEVERISPEAPVPVVQLDNARTHATVGGAGSVMRDLTALGAKVLAAGMVGSDTEGEEVLSTLSGEGIDTSLIITDESRRTTQKTRVISKGHHLLRIDSEEKRAMSRESMSRLVDAIAGRMGSVDAVILSDYDKGVLSAECVRAITAAARKAGKSVWADPAKGRDFAVFRGVSVVTPNRKETEEATGEKIPVGSEPTDAAQALISSLGLDAVVITLDSEGIYYQTASGEARMISARPRAAYDVTGAGDMVIAAAVYGAACGMEMGTALLLANFAAGMEVERVGAQPITRREMVRRLEHEANIASEKVLAAGELAEVLAHRRRRGEKVVFTNGCFDILHAGHIKYLQFARQQGDFLVVGLNSDKSVAALKGANRPIVAQAERAMIVSALAAVDYVVIFDDETPAALIKEIRPDILVKGEDWREKGVVGRDTVEAGGGKVILAPLVEGLSTTGIVERVLDAYSGGKKSE